MRDSQDVLAGDNLCFQRVRVVRIGCYRQHQRQRRSLDHHVFAFVHHYALAILDVAIRTFLELVLVLALHHHCTRHAACSHFFYAVAADIVGVRLVREDDSPDPDVVVDVDVDVVVAVAVAVAVASCTQPLSRKVRLHDEE